MKKAGGTRKRLGELRLKPGVHPLALEYLVAGYALEGYNAATIRRKLSEDHPDLFDHLVNETSVLWLLRRAMEYGVVRFGSPCLRERADQLHKVYLAEWDRSVRFTVADDSICFQHATSLTPFFWNVAADTVADCIEQVLATRPGADGSKPGRSAEAPQRVVVGNTGGPSVSESIKPLVRRGMDPVFLDLHSDRLLFLSLTAAGSARQFDCHSNYLAALMGQAYRAGHLAVVNNGDDEAAAREYDEALSDLRLLIGGVGGPTGYLMTWCREHQVPMPEGMIGDVFFTPINAEGHMLRFSREAERLLAPLRLRPTRQELNEFGMRSGRRALVIATESRGGVGEPAPDKSVVLDQSIRAGLVTDCVLGGNLAKRLLLRYGLSPKD